MTKVKKVFSDRKAASDYRERKGGLLITGMDKQGRPSWHWAPDPHRRRWWQFWSRRAS